MRHEILMNEVESATENLNALEAKQLGMANNVSLLNKEKQQTQEKMRMLQEELNLIDKHLESQAVKQNELKTKIASESGRISGMQESLASLKAEMEKLKILSSK